MHQEPAETFYKIPCPVFTALLTDTHNTDPDPILRSLQAHRPEMICIAGDFVSGERAKNSGHKMEESGNAEELFCGCSAIAPTFVSIGNHEWMLSDFDIRIIKETGITLLDNDLTSFEGVVIGGLSSAYYTGYRVYKAAHPNLQTDPKYIKRIFPHTPEPDLSILDRLEKADGFRILLCHHPEYYPKYLKNRKANLIFSGHCHGGQWRYYSLLHKEERGLYAPGQGLFPGLTAGIHDGRLVISRGLSNPTFVPRINNPTEIIYIRPQ